MKRYSLHVLILANLIPVVGVLFLHWSLFSILFFYWLESAVVGLYNVPKLLMARVPLEAGSAEAESSPQTHGRFFFVGFFLLHYGIFMLAHGLCVFIFFGPADLDVRTIVIGLVSLGLSHGVSFLINFVGRREYARTTIPEQMVAPYKRIIIMHLTIIFGGFLVGLFGAPVFALVCLVLLKVAVDAASHLREHTKLGTFLSQVRATTEVEKPL